MLTMPWTHWSRGLYINLKNYCLQWKRSPKCGPSLEHWRTKVDTFGEAINDLFIHSSGSSTLNFGGLFSWPFPIPLRLLSPTPVTTLETLVKLTPSFGLFVSRSSAQPPCWSEMTANHTSIWMHCPSILKRPKCASQSDRNRSGVGMDGMGVEGTKRTQFTTIDPGVLSYCAFILHGLVCNPYFWRVQGRIEVF